MTSADLVGLFPNASESFKRRNGLAAAPQKRATGPLEADFQSAVIALAKTLGWEVFHVRDSRRQQMVAFPDLVLVRERVLFRELKRTGRTPTIPQQAVLDMLTAAGQDAACWTPDDWEQVRGELVRRVG